MNPNRNRYDNMTLLELIVIITICVAFILVGLVVGISQAIVYVETCKTELRAAENINLRQKAIYNSQANIDRKIISDEEYESRKKRYVAEELSFQQEMTLKYETEVAKKMCQVGSYVHIKDLDEVVHVYGFIGYEAQSYENISFQVIDIDNWEYASKNWYIGKCLSKGRTPR